MAKMTTNCNSYGSDSMQSLILLVYMRCIDCVQNVLDQLGTVLLSTYVGSDLKVIFIRFLGCATPFVTGVHAPFVLLRIIHNEPVCLSGFIFAARGLFKILNTSMM